MEYLIHVCGLVQGVGFRPYVCRLAGEMGLAGSVDNDTGGVSIRLMANPEQKNRFLPTVGFGATSGSTYRLR